MGKDWEYRNLARLLGHVIFTQSDDDPGKEMQTQILERDKKYTELLNSYTTITKFRLVCKEVHKWLFFWMVITASVLCLVISYRLINIILEQDSVDAIVDAFPALLSAFTAFIATVVAVPLTIAQFLFNTGEDDNITKLIQHTQDHDVSGIDVLKERFSEKTRSKQQTAGRTNQPSFEEVIGD